MKKALLLIITATLFLTGCTKAQDDLIIHQSGISLSLTSSNLYYEESDLSGLSTEEVREWVDKKARDFYVPVVNAAFDPKTWEVTKHSYGRKLKVEETVDAIMEAEEGMSIELVYEELSPRYFYDEVKDNIKEIVSSSTNITNKMHERINNMTVAGEAIDGVIIKSGEEFSFNDIVGRRTVEKGYMPAPIIIKTDEGSEYEVGIGGGICQLSSTIYCAALDSKMQITERHAHSKEVNYVPTGRDATIVFGMLDLKFINNREFPIMIKVQVTGDTVNVHFIENRNIKS